MSAALCVFCCIVLVLSSGMPIFAAEAAEKGEVIVGGSLFGVQMYTEGVLVVGLDKVTPYDGGATRAPAYDCGIRMKDIITKIDGKAVKDASSVTESISKSNGKPIVLTVRRGENEKQFTLTPTKDKDGNFRAGLWIRDTAAGIGTITYVDPKTGEFAGLGHGICDGDTGALLPIRRGAVSQVEITGIVKGRKGAPGELKGAFSGSKNGALIKNTDSGVYGVFTRIPEALGDRMRLASTNELREGKELIRSAVSGCLKDYEVSISKINKDKNSNKSFVVTVTDKTLLDLTGGVIQGMSGSPIIQDGKLIGAVTHVMINDPTTGYGIFIENMLNAANIPMAKAS